MIGADAAVSSIMDGDDADGGAEPVGRGERNRNRERKERGRETHPVTHARVRIYTYTRASQSFGYTPRRGSHPGTRPRSHRDTPASGDAGAAHTHQWFFLIFTHTGLEAETHGEACTQLVYTQT